MREWGPFLWAESPWKDREEGTAWRIAGTLSRMDRWDSWGERCGEQLCVTTKNSVLYPESLGSWRSSLEDWLEWQFLLLLNTSWSWHQDKPFKCQGLTFHNYTLSYMVAHNFVIWIAHQPEGSSWRNNCPWLGNDQFFWPATCYKMLFIFLWPLWLIPDS